MKSEQTKTPCTCQTCEYGRLDEDWGEFKCDVMKCKIHNPDAPDCKYYKKKSKNLSKSTRKKQFV